MGGCGSKGGTSADPVLTKNTEPDDGKEPPLPPAATPDVDDVSPAPAETPVPPPAVEGKESGGVPAALPMDSQKAYAVELNSAVSSFVFRVIESAIARADHELADELAHSLVSEAIAAGIASEAPVDPEDVFADLGKKIGEAWANTADAVGEAWNNTALAVGDLVRRMSRRGSDESAGLGTPRDGLGTPRQTVLDTPRGSLVSMPVLAAPSETPLISGYLIKKASSFPFNWLNRYCVFYASTKSLAYYASEEDAMNKVHMKGERTNIKSVSVCPTEEFGITFEVVEGKPLHCRCGSEEERSRWLSTLRDVLGADALKTSAPAPESAI
ncbi:hypothetical protein AB1Y20_013405 [Prymnesium parvum]|uniref:PH domain-containing protein n=1 Tax=Prymnesium parvum TaxID=97485 RepID=A0AB34IIZ9_PRYPA